MDYHDRIISFLIENNIGKSVALDLASGGDQRWPLRHAMILKEYFEKVYANEHSRIPDEIKTKLNEICRLNPTIEMLWGDMRELKRKETYDLICFGFPEVAYYEFFIENALKLSSHLKENGKFLFSFKVNKYNNDEEEFG
jgi:hypothetical protein